MIRALLLVDLQNDFFPGGTLAVKEGDKVLPAINKLLSEKFDLVIASKDWHPPKHGSFASTHGKKPGERVDLSGMPQILWPDHCIQGTHGAEFAPGWDSSVVEKTFFKGTDKDIDSYSAFFDNGKKRSTGLGDYLREKNVSEIYLAGLTTEYCVKYSAMDAVDLGFTVFVVQDACRAINLKADDEKRAYEEMKRTGVHLVIADQLK